MYFSFYKYEKEKLTLLSQNLVQQTEQKRYFSLKDVNAKRHFHLQNFPPLTTVSLQNSHFSLILDVFRGKKALFRNKKRCDRKKIIRIK